MLVLIDNANLKEIESLYRDYPYDGVTTNPSILMKEHKNPFKVLKDIRAVLPDDSMLHAQVVSEGTDKMVEEAHFMLNEIREDLFIKVPVTTDGLRAIHILKKEGINVTATAVYTAMQAFMAAKAGARYTAPYVNRLDNMGADGVQVAKDIHDMFRIHNMEADVLAASFKNSQQILNLCKHGIGSVTAAPDVLRALTYHDATFTAEENFTHDFYSLLNEVEGTHLK
ncbi:transaldolase family protein [Christensenella minuta]|uniref:transaldolase family protein n=1 Tax=Christensenella minuta TaxID=626937 RepID=UPI002A7FFADA|nr:transaldolase family protein [Christensenella minuta]MDY3751941.1 transaldolase family protein [Christensenella minuta]